MVPTPPPHPPMAVGLGNRGQRHFSLGCPPQEQIPSPGSPTLLPCDWAGFPGVLLEFPNEHVGLLRWVRRSALVCVINEDVTAGDPSLVLRNSQA